MNPYGLKDEVIEFIRDEAARCGLCQVKLFGSRATGKFSAKSDIDLAVSGDGIQEFQEAIDERCPTLLMVDYVDLSQEISPELRSRIETEGVALYG